jgi:hypothetical protein
MRRYPILVVLLACAAVALPRSSHGQTIRGIGARPCSEWVQARSGGGRDFWAEQWVLGYLSGVNATYDAKAGGATHISLFASGDDKQVFATIDSYCRSHAQDMLWSAVKALVSQRRAS